jgi:hypothetical protein
MRIVDWLRHRRPETPEPAAAAVDEEDEAFSEDELEALEEGDDDDPSVYPLW